MYGRYAPRSTAVSSIERFVDFKLPGSINAAVKSRSLFSCCGLTITPDILECELANISLSKALVNGHTGLATELAAPPAARLYCSSCCSFILSTTITASNHDLPIFCRYCTKYTCRNCKVPGGVGKNHSPQKCKQDQAVIKRKKEEEGAGEQLKELAKTTGWRQCPQGGCGR